MAKTEWLQLANNPQYKQRIIMLKEILFFLAANKGKFYQQNTQHLGIRHTNEESKWYK
jgi:hypothetical protein